MKESSVRSSELCRGAHIQESGSSSLFWILRTLARVWFHVIWGNASGFDRFADVIFTPSQTHWSPNFAYFQRQQTCQNLSHSSYYVKPPFDQILPSPKKRERTALTRVRNPGRVRWSYWTPFHWTLFHRTRTFFLKLCTNPSSFNKEFGGKIFFTFLENIDVGPWVITLKNFKIIYLNCTWFKWSIIHHWNLQVTFL